MATDVVPQPENLPNTVSSTRRAPSPALIAIRAWLRRLLLLVFVCCLLGAAAMSLRAFAEPEAAPALTHTITRSDLVVTIIEQGLVESAENHEVKSKVRGWNTVLWIIDSGTFVEKGDELVRLDSSVIQEQIDERTKYANWSQSAADRSAAGVARAELAVFEYEQGRYIAGEMTLAKDVVVAEATLRSARDRLRHTQAMARSEYVSELEVEEKEFAVRQAELNVELKRTQLEVLRKFTHREQMQTLSGNFKSIKARHEANAERATADTSRRDRAVDEIQHCVLVADRRGLVIHPNAAKWESGPIAEGTNVHKDQVLLLMPDLSTMQVKVGVHEAAVKRVKIDSPVRVTLADGTLEGRVSHVASITKPAGWWTANEVRYDTLVSLPPVDGLRPGMSAEVKIVIAEYQDVLTIPVAAIVENDGEYHCWLKTGSDIRRRPIKVGDSNDVFTIVEEGLQEGNEVLLNPSFYEDTNANDQEPEIESSESTIDAAGI